MDKAYDHRAFEDEIYKKWEESGVFTPKIEKGKAPFVISMPPPNVTGKLHIGHALGTTLQDIMIRYHRMKGDASLFLPGVDHAGIATQNVVERQLSKEGLRRHDLGREKFVERVWKWKEEYGSTITGQIRKIGASCDWTRERFTLDEGLTLAVKEAFVDFYEKGLIYRGLRTVNWCPRCQTAIADDEVEYKKELGKFYFIKYGPFKLATARPETKLGDTAVAVHPSDKRYKDMVGKKYMIPGVLGKFEIVVVADNAVDPKFGTGAVKVTPAHSLVDYEIAQRHNVALKQVIDENGRMMANAGKYAGMKTKEAREAIVEDMQKMGLIDKIEENYEHNVAVCYRCSGQIEPIPSKQWFVKMKPLAEKAKKAVESGEIKIMPKRFEKVYFHWMDNIRDWCISRQLWWGHRLPVYYRKQERKSKMENDGSDIYVGVNPPKDAENWVQDEDVLDTWFSSGLWPFSTLGWPNLACHREPEGRGDLKIASSQASRNDTKGISDFDYFFPTSVLETGYDILFFWVARMIMMSLELTGKIPFDSVYLHGLIRDEKNRKMSKSLGNIIDPLDVIEKYGADALRFSLVVGSTPGQDLALGESKIRGYRNFSNKVWNISRFVITNFENTEYPPAPRLRGAGKIQDLNVKFSKQDQADLERLDEVVKKVSKMIEEFKFSQAGELLYDYTWHEFADKIIEQEKERLGGEDEKEQEASVLKLTKILTTVLKMLHPYMPYVTEAAWSELPQEIKDSKLLISSSWPK